jgi:hypothetical protein
VGGNYKLGELSIGAIDYYSNDIINIFYTEGKYGFPIGESLKLRMAFQYTDQTSVGDELLQGTDFSAHQWGAKTELAFGGALFTVAYTSAGGDSEHAGTVERLPGVHQRAGRGLQPRRRGCMAGTPGLYAEDGAGPD